MTLVRNRAHRQLHRRAGALERLGNRRIDTPERKKAVSLERDILKERLKLDPSPRFTRKKLRDPNCSQARKDRRAGKGI